MNPPASHRLPRFSLKVLLLVVTVAAVVAWEGKRRYDRWQSTHDFRERFFHGPTFENIVQTFNEDASIASGRRFRPVTIAELEAAIQSELPSQPISGTEYWPHVLSRRRTRSDFYATWQAVNINVEDIHGNAAIVGRNKPYRGKLIDPATIDWRRVGVTLVPWAVPEGPGIVVRPEAQDATNLDSDD